MKILKHKKLLLYLFVFLWIFIGFLQFFNFPPLIQEAEAATGPGFQPDYIQFLSDGKPTVFPGTGGKEIMVGHAISSTHRAVTGVAYKEQAVAAEFVLEKKIKNFLFGENREVIDGYAYHVVRPSGKPPVGFAGVDTDNRSNLFCI